MINNVKRWELSEVRLIIIDEISMVSSILFYQVNQRLNELFGYSGNEPFAVLPVIVCGDVFQLPLVKGLPLYNSAASIKDFIALELWRKFQMVELTEVMHRRGDWERRNSWPCWKYFKVMLLKGNILSPNMLGICLQKANQQKNIMKLN